MLKNMNVMHELVNLELGLNDPSVHLIGSRSH